MSRPRLAIGHDETLPGLSYITPEPATEPVQSIQREYGLGGKFYSQGKYAAWHWPHVDGEAEYLALLAQMDLDDNDTAEVTIYTKNERLIWTRYNAIATLPESGQDMKWQNMFPRDITIYFTDLEELD